MNAFYSQLTFVACCCLAVAIGMLIYKIVYTKMNSPEQDNVQIEKADLSGAKECSPKKRRVIKPRDVEAPSSENNSESEVTDS